MLVFSADDDGIDAFVKLMLESCNQVDTLTVWFNLLEDFVCKKFGIEEDTYIYPTSLEPFWFENPWSSALRGKKVLVIHPFEETIHKQYENRNQLFKNPNILPEFTLYTVKAVQSLGGQSDTFATWFDALEYMYKRRRQSILISLLLVVGVYGFPLAAKLKALKKK